MSSYCHYALHSWPGVQCGVFERAGSHELEVRLFKTQRPNTMCVVEALFLWNLRQLINWVLTVFLCCRSFSNFQYFDSKGMFISLVFSIPLLLNTVIIVVGFIAHSTPCLIKWRHVVICCGYHREKLFACVCVLDRWCGCTGPLPLWLSWRHCSSSERPAERRTTEPSFYVHKWEELKIPQLSFANPAFWNTNADSFW